MSEPTEPKHEEKVAAATTNGGIAKETRVEEVREHTPSRQHRAATVAILAVAAMAGMVALAWFLWPSKAGRPVPAPRTITLDQPTNPGNSTATTEPTLSLPPDEVQRAGIKVEPVGERQSTDMAGQLATGVVQPNAYRETPVMSLVGGIVRNVGTELGRSVRRGQTIAVITSSDLADAQSRYLKALADLEEHHKHHARTANLVEIGAASREEYEQSTSRLKSAESQVAAERQRLLELGLNSLRVNALRSSTQISSEVTIPAPVAGTITSRTVNPGEVVEANKELMKVTDLSSVWVVGQVYEKDLALIHVGSGASITSDAYPGRVFRGRISYVDPRLDPATRTAQVRIELANPGQTLKIGMYVNVAFAGLGGAESTSPVVPQAAVQSVNNEQVVFMATKDPNIFVMRRVRVGLESNGFYPVQEGLAVGDRVVTDGSFMLRAEWLKSHPNQ